MTKADIVFLVVFICIIIVAVASLFLDMKKYYKKKLKELEELISKKNDSILQYQDKYAQCEGRRFDLLTKEREYQKQIATNKDEIKLLQQKLDFAIEHTPKFKVGQQIGNIEIIAIQVAKIDYKVDVVGLVKSWIKDGFYKMIDAAMKSRQKCLYFNYEVRHKEFYLDKTLVEKTLVEKTMSEEKLVEAKLVKKTKKRK